MASQMIASSDQSNQMVIVRQEVPNLLVGQGEGMLIELFMETSGQPLHSCFGWLPDRSSDPPKYDRLMSARVAQPPRAYPPS